MNVIFSYFNFEAGTEMKYAVSSKINERESYNNRLSQVPQKVKVVIYGKCINLHKI